MHLKIVKLVILLFLIHNSVFSIKFIIPIKDKTVIGQDQTSDIINKELIIQAVLDSGFSAKAVADQLGITDYISVFLKPAFHIGQFGIGFDFDFRFRVFNSKLEFIKYNWVYSKTAYNAGLNTFLLYFDKIDYIIYGTSESPFFFKIGRLPYITFAGGLIIRDFHNHAFEPVQKEQGLYFKFNGNYLDRIKWLKIPVDAAFFLSDLADPDIFAFDAGVDVFDFTRFKGLFNNRAGFTFITDINAGENNRVSSLYNDEEMITSHRNLSTADHDLYTSFPLFFSINDNFKWKNEKIEIIGTFESAFLLHFKEQPDFDFGAGIKLAVETKVLNLQKSGFLLGIKTGFIMQSPHFFTDYFSSNYEILRHKQIDRLDRNNEYTFFALLGINIYAINEKIKFITEFKFPVQSKAFMVRMSMKFILEDTLVKGLGIGIYFESGVNAYYIKGAGGSFIESLTRDFRFAAECFFKFYSAKFTLQIGIQRPAWNIPQVLEGDVNAYEILAKDGIISYYDPLSYTGNSRYLNDSWNYDSEVFKDAIQKFVKLEISFVL